MGPDRDRTRDPWICSQTRYRLRYAARQTCNEDISKTFTANSLKLGQLMEDNE